MRWFKCRKARVVFSVDHLRTFESKEGHHFFSHVLSNVMELTFYQDLRRYVSITKDLAGKVEAIYSRMVSSAILSSEALLSY